MKVSVVLSFIASASSQVLFGGDIPHPILSTSGLSILYFDPKGTFISYTASYRSVIVF